MTPSGFVSTFATGIGFPGALVFDSTGTLYVANGSGQIRIDQVSPAGVVTPFATNFTTTGYGLGFFALPIPEPATAIIFPLIAAFASARRARRRARPGPRQLGFLVYCFTFNCSSRKLDSPVLSVQITRTR